MSWLVRGSEYMPADSPASNRRTYGCHSSMHIWRTGKWGDWCQLSRDPPVQIEGIQPLRAERSLLFKSTKNLQKNLGVPSATPTME